MAESDPLRIMFEHDRWATSQVLEACAELPGEAMDRRFDIGSGSLHDTLTHIVGVMRALTETLSGSEPRPRLEGGGSGRSRSSRGGCWTRRRGSWSWRRGGVR